MRNPSPGKDRELDARLDAPGRGGCMALPDVLGPSGGTIPDPSVGRLLDGHRVDLAHLIHSDQDVGLEWRTGLRIPMFQVNAQA